MANSSRDREGRERLPPGQTLTVKWPVLHYSHVPRFDPAAWRFRTWGAVERPLDLSWQEFVLLPHVVRVSDFHCVTTWSKLDNRWEGIAFGTIAERTRPRADAAHVMAHCADGYTTNVPLRALLGEDVLLALRHDGRDLEAEHGGPMRLVVPQLYGWKSGKWLCGLEFLTADRRGYWEERGYHNRADPWKEERYSHQEEEEDNG